MNEVELVLRSVGPHLRQFQKLKDYTVVDMAQMLGFSRGYTNRLTNGLPAAGRRSEIPSLEDVCRMAEVMGMAPHELLVPPGQPVEVGAQWRLHDLSARLEDFHLALQATQRALEG